MHRLSQPLASSIGLVTLPALPPATPGTTVNCYEFWDRVFRRAGVLDYTEGFYNGDPAVPYPIAQRRQLDYLLDQAECRAETRVLEIGCGNGSLLRRVRERGGCAVGVTISPHQVDYCRSDGLDVHLLDYRSLSPEWNGQFDVVIANGSMEHFVQPNEASRADTIYRHFFTLCRRMLDPDSPVRRVVNTTIHFGRFQPEMSDLNRSPWSFPWGSDRFHYALLVRGFGGHYPSKGQFQRCARGRFELVAQRDATRDYHWTSETWLNHGLRSLIDVRQWARLVPFALRHPRHATQMMFLLLIAQSWNWQFRGDDPPMTHLWQTWQCV